MRQRGAIANRRDANYASARQRVTAAWSSPSGERDQTLGNWIGQEARDSPPACGRQDAQAGEERARRDQAGAQPGDLAGRARARSWRNRWASIASANGLSSFEQAGRDQPAQLLGLRRDRVGVEAVEPGSRAGTGAAARRRARRARRPAAAPGSRASACASLSARAGGEADRLARPACAIAWPITSDTGLVGSATIA